MNPQEFDRWLRQGDPVLDQEDSQRAEVTLRETQKNWNTLVSRRVIIRRRVKTLLASSGILATAAVLILCVGRWEVQGGLDGKLGRDRALGPRANLQSPVTNQSHPIVSSHAKDASKAKVSSKGEMKQASKTTDQPREIKAPIAGGRKIMANAEKRNRRHQAWRRRNHEIDREERFAAFVKFVEQAGGIGSETWDDACRSLAQRDASVQREAIGLVPKVDDESARSRAFELVCQSAGGSQRQVLIQWLETPTLRLSAWNRLTKESTFADAVTLIPVVASSEERLRLCELFVESSDERSISLLLKLVQESTWRPAVRRSADRLSTDQLQRLVLSMRVRNVRVRTAAAFVLASVSGDRVEQVVSSMILGGRYRHPAYLALLARDTPQARTFLEQATSRWELHPTLISARMHFANMEEQLQRWIKESQGANHESLHTTEPFSPPSRILGRVAGGVVDDVPLG